MALDGFTIGSAPASGSGAPNPAPAPTGGSSALSGFQIGVQAPKAPAAPSGAPAASSTPPVADLVANTPAAPDTSGFFSKFLSMTGLSPKPSNTMNTTTPAVAAPSSQPVVGPDGKITIDLDHPLDALPAISSKLSTDINRPYVAVSDYLKSHVHVAPEVSNSVTAHILEHLSALNPANLAEGLTGGFYQSPSTQRQNAANAAANSSGAALDKMKGDITTSTTELEALKAKLDAAKASVNTSDKKSVDAFNAMVEDYNAKQKLLQPKVDAYNAQLDTYKNDNEKAIALHGDFIDQTLSSLTKAAGAVIGIAAGGELATPAKAVSGIQSMLGKSPLLAKYAGPYVEGFVKTLTGLGIQSQLDPKLAGDMTKRATSLGIAIGTAPLYTALGLIKSPLYSLPASFGLGFGMAKLSGASNEEAVQSGLVFSIMDGVTRAYGTYNRGLSPEDIQVKLRNEAFDTLSRYSGVKITKDSTPAEIKSAYRKALFQTHPDVGGTQESASAVTNAYDLLTRGTNTKAAPDVHNTTEEGAQVSELGNSIKSGLAEHGPDVMHSAIQEHLGVDSETATRLVAANTTPEEVNPDVILQNITGKIEPAPHALPGIVINGTEPNTLEGVNPKQSTKLSNEEAAPLAEKAADAYFGKHLSPAIETGRATVIGGDNLKDFYGNDYNDNNHPVYSQAAAKLYERALEANKNPYVIFTGGGPASGKTELVTQSLIDKGFKGTIYDSNLSNYEGALKQIEAARAAGKEVHIYGVLPNVDAARTFSIQRENRTGRGITDKTFARGHAGFPAVLEKLLAEGVIDGEHVHLLDTRGVTDFKQAMALAANSDFIKDPLAVLRTLGYNEEDFQKTYGKENYDASTGQRNNAFQERSGAGEASPSDRADKGNADDGADEGRVGKTQKERVAEAVAEEPLSIKEVAKLTGILEPNVRRILGVGAKDGTFARVSEGVYVLKTKAGNYAYVEMGDAETSLARMAKEGQKFDSVILDPAYFSRALIGGNRGIKQWNFIQPDAFAKVMKSVADVVKYPDSHVYLMLSGARTAQPDMDQYVKGAVDADFKVVGEGSFTKLTKSGAPSTNVRGKEAAAERLILMTKTGTAREGEISANLHFRFVRVLGKYQTEKPAELMKALIEQSTLNGETVLDPFAGSGVTGAEALKAHRNAVLIEKQKSTVEDVTKPRVEAAAKEVNLTPSEVTKEKTKGPGNTQVPVAEINGERRELPTQLISKTDIKNLVGTLPDKQGDFKVVEKDGQKRMELDTPTGHMSLRPSALGLIEDDINIGDTVHVDAEELKKKGPAFRVTDRYGANRGFISLDPLVKAMEHADASVKDFVEHTLEPIKISDNLTESFTKLEGAAQADLEAVNKLFNTLEINKEDDEALYAHAENPDAPLTPKQQELEATFDAPLKEANAVLYKRIKDLGVPLDDESDTYISRFPKGKASVLQRVFNPSLDRSGTTKQGSVLSKSTSSLKKRTMKALTDASGKRTVVAIKDGEVTAFVNKQATPLGTLDRTITPKVKEFFDPTVRGKLEKLAADLGVTHERHATGKTLGLGGSRAGVSFQGESLIKTRLSPDSVLAHELGHQIDHKYGMQAFMKEEHYDAMHRTMVLREMKALADKRFEGQEVSENFKKYVRKGSEKMAVMFEAYVSNKAMFKEVAPHLYDTFVDFLSEHKELQPFLDIKSGVQLGSTVHGGEHIAGKNGTAFIDKDGKKYTIGEATTAEIEQHTNLEYYHSAAASRLLQYVKLRQIDRALQFLETWKASADFAKVAVKNDEIPPSGWKMTSQINFRNYYFEPRIAEALDDFQGQMDRGQYNDAFRGINRILANAIFFNGLAHPINVAVTWLFQRGASSYVNPYAYGRAFRAGARALKAMQEKNADYMMLLKQGAHLMSSDVSNQKLAENMARRLGEALDTQPQLGEKIMKAIGWTGDQFSFRTNVIYKLSHDMAWLSNDFLTMQAIFERMESEGMSMEEAIKDASRFIPDYRDQSRLLDAPLSAAGKVIGKEKEGGATARWLAKIVYNRNISLFASYHVGLLQSLTNAVKDTFNAGEGFSGEANKKRAQGADKLAMLGLLMIVIYPWLDKELSKLTGEENTYITRSGITKYPYLAYKWAVGNTTTSQALQQVITPAVGTELILEQFFDHDFFTGNQLSGPGGEGRLKLTLNAVAPYNEFQRWASGKTNAEDFFLTMLGVHSPKNTQTALDLNSMIYTEKPQVNAEAKARIAAGDKAGALAVVTDFNDRLSVQIRKADATTGNWSKAVADARVKYFLNQYGLRMPGDVAMANFAAKQGKSIIDRTLPNGKPVIVKDTSLPATGVIGVITTYARAIGSDPVTAFKDIFTGQSIRAVENGNIIVNRMSLSDSQSKKKGLGGGTIPKGMTLDHIQPLEGGGTNEDGNLQLITTAQDKANQSEEDFVGRQLKAGTMTSAQAREISIRYKAGQGQPLSPSLMQEYADKYGSKPLSLEDVYNFANVLK